VLIRCAARSTLAGVMWLAEPRSSVAPHFDGQRSLGDGGCQVCAVASALKAERPKTITMARLFMAFLLFDLRRSKRVLPEVCCPSDNGHKRGAGREPARGPMILFVAVIGVNVRSGSKAVTLRPSRCFQVYASKQTQDVYEYTPLARPIERVIGIGRVAIK